MDRLGKLIAANSAPPAPTLYNQCFGFIRLFLGSASEENLIAPLTLLNRGKQPKKRNRPPRGRAPRSVMTEGGEPNVAQASGLRLRARSSCCSRNRLSRSPSLSSGWPAR